MARLELDGLGELNDFFSGLEKVGADVDRFADEAINECTPTLVNSLRSKINGVVSDSSYGLANSIAPTDSKKNAYGHFAAVRPVGTDSKGVRQGAKLAYLEYGVSSKGIARRPVMAAAVASAEPQIESTIRKRFEEYVDSNIN